MTMIDSKTFDMVASSDPSISYIGILLLIDNYNSYDLEMLGYIKQNIYRRFLLKDHKRELHRHLNNKHIQLKLEYEKGKK